MKTISCLTVLSFLAGTLAAQPGNASELFMTLKATDSLLFNVGFNTCDLSQFENLTSEDFEFYHDKSGITPSKSEFLSSIKDGLCKLSYKARRELVQGSLEVFPLENKGVLYGAIQMGRHRFYAKEEGKKEHFTSIAKFTHVWIIDKGEWKLQRGLSYDHQTADTSH